MTPEAPTRRHLLGGLRPRLFLSYVTLLLVALGVVLAALVLLVSTRPAPPDQTYRRLAPVALSVDYRGLLLGTQVGVVSLQEALQNLADGLRQVADERGVRILLIRGPENTILFDSQGEFAAGTPFPERSDRTRCHPGCWAAAWPIRLTRWPGRRALIMRIGTILASARSPCAAMMSTPCSRTRPKRKASGRA